MLEKEGKVDNWPSLVNALEEVYGASVFETPEYALFKLVQEDSVTSYYATFVSLAIRVEGVSPSAMLKCFISGLGRENQRTLFLYYPSQFLKQQNWQSCMRINILHCQKLIQGRCNSLLISMLIIN